MLTGLGATLGLLRRRPLLLVEAIRVLFAMRRRGRLTPSKAYLQWRAYTAYGDHKARVQTEDLVHYLAWRRRLRRSMQGGSGS